MIIRRLAASPLTGGPTLDSLSQPGTSLLTGLLGDLLGGGGENG